ADVRLRPVQRSTESQLRQGTLSVSSPDEFRPVIIGRVAIERMDMLRTRLVVSTWRTRTLGRKFDLYGRALDPKIGGSSVCGRSAPRKEGVRQIRSYFGHLSLRIHLIDDAYPFLNQVNQHRLLACGERCRPDSFRLNYFTVVSRSENAVCH